MQVIIYHKQILNRRVQVNNTEITLSLIFSILIIVMIVIIINYNHPIINQLSILYIHAEPNDDNKEKEEKRD